LNFFLSQKGCYKKLVANLTEPSKINQIAVMTWPRFKLNKAERDGFLYFILKQTVMMNSSKIGVPLFIGLAVILVGCSNQEKTHNEIDYNQLYFDYSITGEENNDNVTCVFQYKYGGEEGKAVNIEPAEMVLDADRIKTDSAKLTGFFYEIQKPVDSFQGKHTIVFKTPGKEYRNEFEFFPFTSEELPKKVHRKAFSIQLKDFPSREKSVRLLLLDTAFESSGFNDLVAVINGKVTIDTDILQSVKNGPIILEMYIEQEIPLRQRTLAGGKISITYGLKKEFELVN